MFSDFFLLIRKCKEYISVPWTFFLFCIKQIKSQQHKTNRKDDKASVSHVDDSQCHDLQFVLFPRMLQVRFTLSRCLLSEPDRDASSADGTFNKVVTGKFLCVFLPRQPRGN